MRDFSTILTELGYTLSDGGDYWRAQALYRGGDNNTALRIHKKTGRWNDFVEGRSGKFEELVKLTNAEYKLEEGEIPEATISVTKKPDKIYSKDILNRLIPHYSYLNRRGITDETAKTFEVGLAHNGKLYRRIVIPIFDISYSHIVGATGRYNSEKVPEHVSKYKHEGKKTNWVWPAHLSKGNIMETGEIYLVESPMCVMALWQCGIRNTLCTFGLKISSKLLSFIVACNPSRIYVCLNNEESRRGNEAADKMMRKLMKFFNEEKIKIKLPSGKDFSDMLQSDPTGESITKWKNE